MEKKFLGGQPSWDTKEECVYSEQGQLMGPPHQLILYRDCSEIKGGSIMTAISKGILRVMEEEDLLLVVEKKCIPLPSQFTTTHEQRVL